MITYEKSESAEDEADEINGVKSHHGQAKEIGLIDKVKFLACVIEFCPWVVGIFIYLFF